MKKIISLAASAAVAVGAVTVSGAGAADDVKPSLYFTVNDSGDGVETLKYGTVFVDSSKSAPALPCAIYIKDEAKAAALVFAKWTTDNACLKVKDLTGPVAQYGGTPYKGFDTDDSMNLASFEELNVLAVNYSRLMSQEPLELNGDSSDSYPLACFDAEFTEGAKCGSYALVVYNEGDYISEIYSRPGGASSPSENSQPLRINLSDRALGDVNNDGRIDSVDASAILREYSMTSSGSGSEFDGAQTSAADVNGDGRIDSVDASTILAYYALISGGSGELSLNEFTKQK